MIHLHDKTFSNRFTSTFPGDTSGDKSSRHTPGVLFSTVSPTPVKEPRLISFSKELAEELQVLEPDKKDIDILAGNSVSPSMVPYAACYGGHQFGHWAGQLGDGRAITLGEWDNGDGKWWELQLKGAGQTPYSRRADGRAVLRSSLREYLMSEAMHHLGVPTTRALSLVTTGEAVLRDMFYDGNAQYEPGAIVCRVSPTFLRFGNYQILAARNEIENLSSLVNWTIDNFYPHIKGDDKIIQWFSEIVDLTAQLMVEWQRVGFVHGVMNTDNMSILGLTIDYGPYSFVDDYDPNFTPNTTDLPGRRYAFGRQASVAHWNLSCLAGALSPLFADTEALAKALDEYQYSFSGRFYEMMARKCGFDRSDAEERTFINDLVKNLSAVKPDMTIFFQLLREAPANEDAVMSHFSESFYNPPSEDQGRELIALMMRYMKRINANKVSSEKKDQLMENANPRFILRNYLLHQAIQDLQNGDETLLRKLEAAMKTPYTKEHDEFLKKRPEWATKMAGCSMLSCSS